MLEHAAGKWFSLDVNAGLSDLKLHVILRNIPEDQAVHQEVMGLSPF